MTVIAIASHKGGTGKTTSAFLLGEALAAQGRRALVVDASEAPSLHLLAGAATPAARPEPAVDSRAGDSGLLWHVQSSGAGALDAWSGDFDAILVDTGALTEPATQELLAASDWIVFAVQPTPLALRTLGMSVEVSRWLRAEGGGRPRPAGLLLTMVDDESQASREVAEALEAGVGGAILRPWIPLDDAIALRSLGVATAEAMSGVSFDVAPGARAYAKVAAELWRVAAGHAEPAVATAPMLPVLREEAAAAAAMAAPRPKPGWFRRWFAGRRNDRERSAAAR